MVAIVSSIPHCVNKALQRSALVLQPMAPSPLWKCSLPTTSSPLLISSSTRLPSTGTGPVVNLMWVVWSFVPPTVPSAMVVCTTLSLQRHTLPTRLACRCSLRRTPWTPRVSFSLPLRMTTLPLSWNPSGSTDQQSLRSPLATTPRPLARRWSNRKVPTSPSSATVHRWWCCLPQLPWPRRSTASPSNSSTCGPSCRGTSRRSLRRCARRAAPSSRTRRRERVALPPRSAAPSLSIAFCRSRHPLPGSPGTTHRFPLPTKSFTCPVNSSASTPSSTR
mmetsp:Transcript_6819/g.21962  ORF Transcript_6819/g.21962 Transcript_6819/m.21962 type:complete len:277 (-) Transcript_6819:162-992(-)